jgi:hypothetical protein|tara:strand:+ start:1040 stop:1204 length:165 start_codon:yes stop_codon:yes gene_type:complete
MSYKFLKDPFTGENLSNVIQRTSDQAVIPLDEKNTDYQVYSKWLANGNTPEAAD